MYPWDQYDADKVDPPREALLVAFADAIDAWGRVEWHFNSIVRLIIRSQSENFSFAILDSCGNVRNQLELIDAIGEFHFEGYPEALSGLRRLLERSRKLAKKRNRIVHSKWIATSYVDEDNQLVRAEFFRDYSRKLMQTMPGNPIEASKLKGTQRFYIDDLERARDEFLKLASDLFGFTEVCMNPTITVDEGAK